MLAETAGNLRILVVDDDDRVGDIASEMLARAGFAVTLASSAAEGQRAFETHEFELALCDINLRGESGLELARHVVRSHPDTAVIMISGIDDPRTAAAAIELGAYGYVVKPFTGNELLIGVLNGLRRRRVELESRKRRAELQTAMEQHASAHWEALERLKLSEHETRRSQTEGIRRLADAVELRDGTTGRHIARMSRFAAELARHAGMDPDRRELLLLASPLHDVGKIAIPDRILLKPGPLTPSEREVMNTHAEIGHRMLAGSGMEPLDVAATIALTHHERFDGNGYPLGIEGEGIPLEGRIVAIADVFDALTSERPYRAAFSCNEAAGIMLDGRGSHFDPYLLDLFLVSVAARPEWCSAA